MKLLGAPDEKNPTAYVHDEKSHKKKYGLPGIIFFFPDDFGLRSPVILKLVHFRRNLLPLS